MVTISSPQKIFKAFVAPFPISVGSPQSSAPDLGTLSKEVVARSEIQNRDYGHMRERNIKGAKVWESVFITDDKRIFFYHSFRQIDPDPEVMIRSDGKPVHVSDIDNIDILELIYSEKEKKYVLTNLPQEDDDPAFMSGLINRGKNSKYFAERTVKLKN
jgi:hypothetical protein